ncbi:MAG TPA: proton-conducting transporter membrane subunit [Bradyrhizobium sp.]|nr:proton-conducting transporter membrane subunit [Bradyrhizobium sp.]
MTDFSCTLLVASLALPLAFLCACFARRWRRHALALQWLAPIPGLATGIIGLNRAPISCDLPVLGFSLRLDPSGALLLAVAALLWITVGAALWRDRQPDHRFGVCWLLTMTGSIGVFIAGDLVSFYLVYALVSIPAYGLFAFSDDAEHKRAGAVYMAFTILGEALLLLAFAMLVAGEPHRSGRIVDVMNALPASSWRDPALGLIIAGFGMKIGMIPFNGWMPLTYNAAPIPAAAVLSGAGVKAGVIGLIRFLPLGVPLETWGGALAAIGFFSAFYGVAFGLAQRNPKFILAYSSISQMGVITAALGMALVNGHAEASLNVAFYGANHLLVKATLFLAIGALAVRGARPSHASLIVTAVLAFSLAGLPFTGGALAKLALKAEFTGGAAAVLATVSSIGTALLMTHFLICLAVPLPGAAQECSRGLVRFWIAVALGAILLPWAFYPAVDDVSNALSLGKLLDGLWPVAVGAGLAFMLRRLDLSLPEVPAGDSIVLQEGAFHRLVKLGPAFETLDTRLRQWPAAGVSLLLIILALLAAGISGG